MALTIPVNFVTYPGVSLSAACFAHNRYEDAAAAKCFSNLIATGFQRFEIDVFWDASRQTWSLCPVELGGAGPAVSSSTTTAMTPSMSSTSLAAILTDRDVAILHARQTSSGDALSLPSSPSTESSSTETVAATATLDADPLTTSAVTNSVVPSSPPVPADETIYQVGPYMCSPGTDLSLLVHVLSEYCSHTETDLNATVIEVTLNVHAATQGSDPLGSARAPSQAELPGQNSLLSTIIANNASAFLYTPDNLSTQRSSLNASRSWFTYQRSQQVNSAFFDVETNSGTVSTPDGWPSESYYEMNFGKRIMVEFGDIDPQMSDYNFTGDDSYIFPQDYLSSHRVVETTSDGNVSSGCFFDPNHNSIAAANSSWATTVIGNQTASLTGSALENILSQARNLTYCGISPILNGTLNNLTADESYEPYTTFVESTRWSWGPGQPINASHTPDPDNFNCATLNSTSGYWETSDCSQSHYGACRISDGPYAWRITNSDATYGKIDLACDDDTAFDVPRTALENTYLLSAWRAFQERRNDYDDGPLLWVNINDIDSEGCWVIGQNATCPYDNPPTTGTREVVVPVVAGVIIFVLALLTVLVKCAGNRQQSKRKRRRVVDGWDYEGVPS